MKLFSPARLLILVVLLASVAAFGQQDQPAALTASTPESLPELKPNPNGDIPQEQMRKLIHDVEAAASYGESSIDWLKPFMSSRGFRKGDIVFRKGDVADAMYYSVTGRYRLCEMGIEIPAGQVFGDLGLIAPDNRRTQTIECVEDGEVLTASYQQVKELYFQNPQFGFYFLRLTSERLFQNISRLEQELVRKNEALAALGH